MHKLRMARSAVILLDAARPADIVVRMAREIDARNIPALFFEHGIHFPSLLRPAHHRPPRSSEHGGPGGSVCAVLPGGEPSGLTNDHFSAPEPV